MAKANKETKEKTEPKDAGIPEKEKPVWMKFNEKDIEAIVIKLAKQGLTSEKIGLVLRDTYGIPKTKLYARKIGKILKENNLYKDSELINLEKKRQIVKNHLVKNKKDERAERALAILTARIFEHAKYEKREDAKQNKRAY